MNVGRSREGGGGGGGRELSCSDYEAVMLCFGLGDCGVERAAWEAARLYAAANPAAASTAATHHTFLALHGLVQSRCSYGCSKVSLSLCLVPDKVTSSVCGKATEVECVERLGAGRRDRDQALLLEMSGQRLQIQLGMLSQDDGCPRLAASLLRWAIFRYSPFPLPTALAMGGTGLGLGGRRARRRRWCASAGAWRRDCRERASWGAADCGTGSWA